MERNLAFIELSQEFFQSFTEAQFNRKAEKLFDELKIR